MKKIIYLTVCILIFSVSYSQTGWFSQTSNSSSRFRDCQFLNILTGWAVGWSNTIVKTSNGGVNWNPQYCPSTEGFQCVYFTNAETGWAGGGNANGNITYIYKTTNSGLNWFNQYYLTNSGIIMKMWFVNADTGWAAGYNGKILKTTNGGQTWIQKTSGTTLHLAGMFFINANLGWACANQGLVLKTTDGGESWIPYFGGTNNLHCIHFISSNTGYIVGLNGTIIKSTDGGVSWVSKPAGSTGFLNSVCFVNYNTGWVVGGDYAANTSEIYRTTNGGNNWVLTSPVNEWLGDVYFVNNSTGWVVGNHGVILKTTNGGLSAPPAPTLIFPHNGALNVPVNTTLRWSDVIQADNYTYQISTIPNFGIITDSNTVDTNLYSIPYGVLTNAITYFWRVKASNGIGSSAWSAIWMFSTLPTGVNQISSPIPEKYELYNNYPNPFNPSTKFRFDVPKESHVRILIYDMLGRMVEKVVDGNMSAGSYLAEWNAGKFNSGVYLIRFFTNEYSVTRKIFFLK